MQTLNLLVVLFLSLCLPMAKAQKTVVTIRGSQFYVNGKPTYEGRTWNGNRIDGLLMNSRMVQGIFDDLNPETRDEFAYPDTKKWDADRNTNEFVAAMPLWKSYGLNAFTLNIQGGSPYGYGNKKCLNPGFNPDGSLMGPYMNRLDRILAKADELNMVVILGIFYFGQDQHLADERAVINATDNLVNWLFDKKYRNVLIEIANETNTRGNYDHKILWPDRIHELINRVKNNRQNGYRFLVGTSYEGRVVPTPNVVKSSDLILIHGNGAKQPEQIQTLIDATKQVEGYRTMPIVNNEDDHFDFDSATNNFTVSLKNYVSWGYFDYRMKGETAYEEGYQSVPVDWGIDSDRKRAFFNKVSAVTGVVQNAPATTRRDVVVTDRLEVDSVWAANKVSFDLQTVGNRQYVAYYNRHRMMTVAVRELGSRVWTRQELPNKLHWDSHNSVVLAVDAMGYIHVSGNMHADPLVYFRSTKPFDVSTITEVNTMTGQDEKIVTYPKFFYGGQGELFYSYRSGTSGDGNVLVNKFLPEQGRWIRYLTKPLFEGKGKTSDRSAYHQFTKDADGNFHYAWMWRWTPLVETCHQLCYATSPDLIHWKNAAGETVTLPFRPDDPKLIVDDVPTKGGMHNGRLQTILTPSQEPLLGYIKYDKAGQTQLYLTRFINGKWLSKQVSSWNFRWKFVGGGDQMSEGATFSLDGFSDAGLLGISWKTETGQSGRYAVNPATLALVQKSIYVPPKLPRDIQEKTSADPKMSVSLAKDSRVNNSADAQYVLKWETMPRSHGTHAPAVIPDGPLSPLVLLTIKSN